MTACLCFLHRTGILLGLGDDLEATRREDVASAAVRSVRREGKFFRSVTKALPEDVFVAAANINQEETVHDLQKVSLLNKIKVSSLPTLFFP